MKARLLPRDEWGRLGEATGLPAALPYLASGDTEIVVIEDEIRIVASLGVVRLTHFEGLWIDPAYRNAGVARRLLRLANQVAARWAPWAIAGAASDNMRSMILRVGGVRIPLDTYMVSVGGR